MRIQKILINNFKGIDSLEFEPRMINLVIGRNNTGKTSLIESIDMLYNKENIRKYFSKHFSKLINVNSQQSNIIITSEKGETNLKISKPDVQTVSIEFKKELIKNFKKIETIQKGLKLTEDIEKEIDNLLNTLMTGEVLSELSKEVITVTKDGKEEIYFSFESKKNIRILQDIIVTILNHINKKFGLKIDSVFVPFLSNRFFRDEYLFTHERNSNLKEVILIRSLKMGGAEEKTAEEAIKIKEIEEYIKKYRLLDNVDNLEKFDLDHLIFKNKDRKYTIPYDFMGDGFKGMIGLLWHLSSTNIKNKAILLEEPDAYMHPGYIRQLVGFIIKFSRDMNIQFFITSHNIDFIESFFSEGLPKDDTDYLKRELLIVKMEKTKNYITSETSDYKAADSKKKKLLEDLRGI